MKSLKTSSLFELPFRPYFLLATFSSMMSLIVWILVLNGMITFSNGGLSPIIWHIHEILFGFAGTIVVGFILTASQTWTQQSSIKGQKLMLFVGLWLMVRCLFYTNYSWSIFVGSFFQLIWWMIAIVVFFNQVHRSKNRRNYLFLPLLILLMGFNAALLFFDIVGNIETAMHFGRSSVLVFTLLISVLGGRVIPFFTTRGLLIEPIKTPTIIERLLLMVSILGVLIFTLSHFFHFIFTPASVLFSIGTLHLIRLSFWKSIQTLHNPLLWSLHLAYLLMSIGILLLGLSYFDWSAFGVFLSFSSALHAITIGGIGLMIFSMMSRVALGHTGRKLIIHPVLNITFLFIIIAAFVRVILSSIGYVSWSWSISALLWVLSTSIFLFIYTPILLTKRY
jgi:uncharacterized protein involved in response to NO